MDEVNSTVAADESFVSVPWRPKQLVFRPYAAVAVVNREARGQNLGGFVKRPLVSRLTKDIVETYRKCNPQFNYSDELNPKRFLTTPSAGVLNDGFDNENSDFILSVNCPLVNSETQRRYIVKDMLGQGTFGQVAKCWVAELDRFVAVKIIKNQPAYYQQALVEVSILTTLNKKFDPEDKNHIVRIYDYFVHQRHLCIAFEMLDGNLYELIKLNKFHGLSLGYVQLFSKQILYGLALMKDAAIIHCDLKPENILLCTRKRMEPPEVKIIDFGSACMEDHTVYSYIQSRYYRSPEVVLGYRYTTAIDMWSFGCIVAELFLGLPLFPGASEFDLLKRMIKIIGGQPPDYVLKEAKNTSKFFKCVGSNHEDGSQASSSGRSIYQALSEEEYESREMKKPSIGREYFNHMNLEGIVTKYPYRKDLTKEVLARESQMRLSLIDFLKGLVEFDPAKRWSPLQASKHPFVTGEPFTCPYNPAPETPRVPVSHNVKIDHHPGGGHWFAAGLSPNVLGGNRVAMYNNSHYQVMPYAHVGNFGSLGSHGSYNDGTGLGSSYGSYGDNSNMVAYYSPVGPSAMNNYAQNIPVLGSSPDARRRMQIPHGNGFAFSPAGNFAPMSLGTSPSQFTPPYSQVAAGSPGHYGPSSPARGNCHGSPLGKGNVSGNQMNRRKGWGYSGNLPTQESTPSAHRQGQFPDVNSPNLNAGNWKQGQFPDVNSPNLNAGNWKQQGQFPDVNSPNLNAGNWKQQQRNSGNAVPHGSYGSGKPLLHPKSANHEKPETSGSLPDPADWDPNYSDELLLQDDSSELSNMTMEFSKSMQISQAFAPPESFVGVGRLNQMSHSNMSTQSRLGQQPFQRFSHGRSVGARGGEWSHHVKVPAPLSNYSSGGQRSPGSNNNAPWGRRGNHPIAANIVPSSHGGNEYGRIA